MKQLNSKEVILGVGWNLDFRLLYHKDFDLEYYFVILQDQIIFSKMYNQNILFYGKIIHVLDENLNYCFEIDPLDHRFFLNEKEIEQYRIHFKKLMNGAELDGHIIPTKLGSLKESIYLINCRYLSNKSLPTIC